MGMRRVFKAIWAIIVAVAMSLLVRYIVSEIRNVSLQASQFRTVHNGKEIICKTYINEQYKGDTPLDLRLGKGSFTVRFDCPEPYRPIHSTWDITTEGPAKNITEELVLVEYKARMQAPKNVLAHFVVKDLSETVIGECSSDDEEVGNACTVMLPQPGAYTAEVVELCDNEECARGIIEFSLSGNLQEVTVQWQLPPAQP